jgi:Fanconi anemia group M protein
MIMLLIDKREESKLSRNVEKIFLNLKKPCDKVWLEIGDYVVQSEPSLCIEAKTTADFLQSVKNKRIFNQIDNMDREYDNNILLIYGNLQDATEYMTSNMKYKQQLKKQFIGALSSIALHTDIKPIWVDNYKSAAHVIAALYTHAEKKLIIHKQLPKKIRTDDVRVDVLIQIKGISIEKAKTLLDKFGSIAEIVVASEKEICEVEGIGKVTASNIHKAFNQEQEVKY